MKKKKQNKKESEQDDDDLGFDDFAILEEIEKPTTKGHYIDNPKFNAEMTKWIKKVRTAEKNGKDRPPVTDYIAECFLKIAEHLSYRPNFMNYPYREEMVGDGIENCLMYAHNFNPDKSSNPFSYFTQIIYYAFLRRIEKEKKQSYVKFKVMEENADSKFYKWFKENYFEKEGKPELSEVFNLTERDVERFEEKAGTGKKKPRKKKKSPNRGLM
jgi:hypothetical protein